MIVLTVSVAPVTARQKNVSQNERDRPKTTVANPYPATAYKRTNPRRSIRSASNTIAVLVTRAPAAGAAYSQPYPWAPTRRTSWAKIGSRAVADEKNVARKSSTMVDRITGDENTNRSPS